MPKCEILKPGLWTSVQDLGRPGLAYYAIPTSGVMDQESASLALSLLNLNNKTALLECTMTAPHIQFHGDTTIALTGADMQWTINKEKTVTYTPILIKAGDILRGTVAQNGLRSYIAVKGELKSHKHLGASASYAPAQMGFNKGLPLRKNQILEWESIGTENLNIEITPRPFNKTQVLISKGPEYYSLTAASKSHLVESEFKITSSSNRMGARLSGTTLETTTLLDKSVPVLNGFIQLPPSGQPIVILQDGQTTGGYPRIAYMAREQLNQFNQIGINQGFRFKVV